MNNRRFRLNLVFCICFVLILPTTMSNGDTDYSNDVIEYYEVTEVSTDKVSNEENYIIDIFDNEIDAVGMDMSDSDISEEITENHKQTVIDGKYSDPISNEEDEAVGDLFDAGICTRDTDSLDYSTKSSELDLIGFEDEIQAIEEMGCWDISEDDLGEMIWAEENCEPEIVDFNVDNLTEEQVKKLRWFWTKNENQVNKSTEDTESATEDISYSFREETSTEDISYAFEETENSSESYDDMIEDSIHNQYDSAVFESTEEIAIVESVQDLGVTTVDTSWIEAKQIVETTTDDIETNTAIISGIKLEVSYDDEKQIWCLPVPAQGNAIPYNDIINMLPDGVFMKDKINPLTVNGWNCDTYIFDDGKWPRNGEFVFTGYIDSIGSISLLVSIMEIEEAISLGEIALDVDLASTQGTSCGRNLSWNYEAGTLTISGIGDMYDFRYGNRSDKEYNKLQDAPWSQYKTDIESVEIENGVKSIGNAAFWQCTTLKKVVIPDSVIRIGRCAFAECSSLANINLPENIKTIEYRTFYRCTSLCKMNADDIVHTHELRKVTAKAATCTSDGNIEYYKCNACKKIFIDAGGVSEINASDTVISPKGHHVQKIDHKAATCTSTGNIEYYICNSCGKYFADAQGSKEITKSSTKIAKLKPYLKLSKTGIKLEKKKSSTVTVNYVKGDDVTVKSSNTKIVKVSIKGDTITVTALTTAGSAKITVTSKTDKKLSKIINVNVKNASTSKITCKNVSVKKGKTVQLKPVVSPSYSDDKITYMTSNKKIATVTNSGTVKGVKKGSTTIKITSGKKSVKVKVTVK